MTPAFPFLSLGNGCVNVNFLKRVSNLELELLREDYELFVTHRKYQQEVALPVIGSVQYTSSQPYLPAERLRVHLEAKVQLCCLSIPPFYQRRFLTFLWCSCSRGATGNTRSMHHYRLNDLANKWLSEIHFGKRRTDDLVCSSQ